MNTFITPEAFVIKDEFELIQSATDYALARDQDGWISGQFYRCRLTSAFQLIIDITQNKTIGHTAHIRLESDGEYRSRRGRCLLKQQVMSNWFIWTAYAGQCTHSIISIIKFPSQIKIYW